MLGVLPAEQGFEANDCLGIELHDGLVEETNLLLIECGAERAFETQTAFGAGVHGLIKDFATGATESFGAAKGDVGVLQEILGAWRWGETECDADAGGAGELRAIEIEGSSGQSGLHAFGYAHGVTGGGSAFEEDGELIATEAGEYGLGRQRIWFGDASGFGAGHGIFATQGAEQSAGGIAKDAIPGGRSEGAVEILKPSRSMRRSE